MFKISANQWREERTLSNVSSQTIPNTNKISGWDHTPGVHSQYFPDLLRDSPWSAIQEHIQPNQVTKMEKEQQQP